MRCARAGLRFPVLLLAALVASPVGAAVAQEVSPRVTSIAYAHREPGTGAASLRARTLELVRRGRPLQLTFRVLVRFDPATDTWTPQTLPSPPSTRLPVPAPRQVYSHDSDPVLLRIAEPIGLYWVAWEEEGTPATAFLFAGPILCNDVSLGPAPPGQVATCVPLADRAVARFVPDPAQLFH